MGRFVLLERLRERGEDPILWTSPEGGLMRLNGVIVPLERLGGGDRTAWGAPGVTMTVSEVADADWRGDAELVFALEQGLTVGYRGFYSCG